MVTTFLNRIGNLGLLLIAVALLLGGLAGAAVAHHYDRLAGDSVSAQHGPQGDDGQKSKRPSSNKRGNQGHADPASGSNQGAND